MKRILFFITSLGGGGAEKVLINLLAELKNNKDYDITVQTIFDVGVNRQYIPIGVHYIPGYKNQFPGNKMVMKLFSPRFLYRQFIKEKYDVIVSYLEGPPARIVSGCDELNTRLISWIHIEMGSPKDAAGSFRSFREAKRCYSKFDHIACVSQKIKEDFARLFMLSTPVTVAYNTNDTDKIKDMSKEDIEAGFFSDSTNIISVGRLMPQKGYDRLIEAHRILLDEGVEHEIYILGTGKEESHLKELVQREGVDDTFHFCGYKDNPYKYMKKADAFVCSSRQEGFSTVVTESLVLGLPVISTDCSGASELLGENNEYGIVVENSVQGIVSGLREMICNKKKLEIYRQKAKDRAKRFSKEETVEVVERLINSREAKVRQCR